MIGRRPGRGNPTPDSGDSGVVAVEFALVLPLLVALLFTIVTAGSVYIDQLHLQQVARDAARIASVDVAVACSTATSELAGNSLGTVTCEIVRPCTNGTTTSTQVRLTSAQDLSIPIVGTRSVTLTATSTFICPP